MNNNRGYESHAGRRITSFKEDTEEPETASTDLWNTAHILGKPNFKKEVIPVKP